MKTDAELMNEFFETNHYASTGVEKFDEIEFAKGSPDQPRDERGRFASAGGQIFVSPNEKEGTHFQDALEGLKSQEHAQFHATAQAVVDRVAGGGTVSDIVGDWADGAENSLAITAHSNDINDLRYAASLLGEQANQKAVIAFRNDKAGPDSVWSFNSSTNIAETRDSLAKLGVQFRSLNQTAGGGTRVQIFDVGSSMTDTMQKVGEHFGAPISRKRGFGEFIGGDSREDGHAAYRQIIGTREAAKKLDHRGRQPVGGRDDIGGRGEHDRRDAPVGRQGLDEDLSSNRRYVDTVTKYSPDQPRDDHGRFGSGGSGTPAKVTPHDGAKQTDTKEFKAWFGDSKVVDSDGKPLVVYHGTLGDFNQFSPKYASPESDMGAGYYFTSSAEDAGKDYAAEEGPDIALRVDRTAEIIASNSDRNYDDPAVREEAKQMLGHANQGNIMPVYLSMQNPVVIGKNLPNDTIDKSRNEETQFTYEQKWTEDGEPDGDPTGTLQPLMDGLRESAGDDREAAEEIIGKWYEVAAENDGYISASKVVNTFRENEQMAYHEGADGTIDTHDVLRQAFENAGYDGIIDNTVSKKFGAMGLDHSTSHYIAFKPTQIKSAIGNQGTFDPKEKDITKYSPHQPRDDHGRFGSDGGTSTNEDPKFKRPEDFDQKFYDKQRDEIALRGEVVARELGFPNDKIAYNSNPPPTFVLNGRTIEYAGAANLKTGDITIYTRNTPDEKAMDLVMSHEIGHQMYQPVVDEFHNELERAADHERIERSDSEGHVRMMPLMTTDGSMRENGVDPKLLSQLKESFPVWSTVGKVDNASTSKELEEKDGVSQYSRDWWKAANDGTATRHQAMHETMAEINRVVYESKRDTGKMWGSEEAKQVAPVWRRYYRAYAKAFDMIKGKKK